MTEPSMRLCVNFKGRLSMLKRSTVIFGASMAPPSVLSGATPEHLKGGGADENAIKEAWGVHAAASHPNPTSCVLVLATH
ncbi:hypothetical protein [Rhodopirellula bahusiensis]